MFSALILQHDCLHDINMQQVRPKMQAEITRKIPGHGLKFVIERAKARSLSSLGIVIESQMCYNTRNSSIYIGSVRKSQDVYPRHQLRT